MEYQKIAGAVANLIGNKISKTSPQNNWETVTNENDKTIPRRRFISPKKRQEIIGHMILI